MECKICACQTVQYANGTYYLEDGKHYPVPFFYCRNCNSFTREVDESMVRLHLKAASHTNPANEERFYRDRIGFFRYLHALVLRQKPSINGWLDFGCSYGHLMEHLTSQGVDCTGLELDDHVRRHAAGKGLRVYEATGQLPAGAQYDVISLIDSLYYSREPARLIRELHRLTRPGGFIILRITNRNWLARLRVKWLKKDIGLALGDATISYSRKSIGMLLRNNGFEPVYTTTMEKGKSQSMKLRLFYRLTSLLYVLSAGLADFSPGIIVIAGRGGIGQNR